MDDGQRRFELVRHQVHVGGASGAQNARRTVVSNQLTTGAPPAGRTNDPEAPMRYQRFDQIERRQNLLSMAEVARTETRKRQRRAVLMRPDLSNDPAFMSDADMIANTNVSRRERAIRPPQCARFASPSCSSSQKLPTAVCELKKVSDFCGSRLEDPASGKRSATCTQFHKGV